MAGPLATRDPDEAEYSVIEAAVMETERGRWFLGEFARRNRHAETAGLLESLTRIERAVNTGRDAVGIDRFRLDVLEMSRAIARTRAEIAAIKPPESDGRIVEASDELDSIVSATEQATSEILAAAERVQEVAWALRESGAEAGNCAHLDQSAIAIYTSCSFQDLTAQRTRKVIAILAFLESRVNAMADIWQFAAEEPPEEPESAPAVPERSTVDSDEFVAMSQAEIDFVLVEQEFRKADIDIEIEMDSPAIPRENLGPRVAFFEGDLISVPSLPGTIEDRGQTPDASNKTDIVPQQVPADVLDDAFLFERQPASSPPVSKPQLQIVAGGPAASAIIKARQGVALTPEEAAAALDALQSMSVEERTRLFS